MNIFIGNLHEKIKDQHLEDAFRDYGLVLRAKVIMDKHTGRSRGFGFIEMPNDTQAQKAIERLNGGTWEGNVIKVSKAYKK